MKKFNVLLGIILGTFTSYTYGTGLYISPAAESGVCPGVSILYTAVDNDHYMTGCSYKWTVTNGVIEGGILNDDGTYTYESGNMINVTWNNSTSSGTIKVESYNCNSSTDNQVPAAATYHILSISGKTPGSISGSAAVVFDAGRQVYSAPLFFTTR